MDSALLAEVLLPVAIATIMGSLGLALTPADFRLVLLGASPGGMMANMFTHLSRGDTALSVTMTAISSVASVVTVPLFLGLATDRFGAGDVGASLASDLTIPVAVYSSFMVLTGGTFAWAMSRRNAGVPATEVEPART